MIFSVFPATHNAELDGTGYNSAVSIKFTPRTFIAYSSCSNASSSVFCTPHVIVPRHTFVTSMEEFPSVIRGNAVFGICVSVVFVMMITQ